MKRSLLLVLAWLLTTATLALADVRPSAQNTVVAGGTPDDDSVNADKMADDDFGGWTCAAGVCAIDADSLTAAMVADGSWGLFTVTSNVAALTNGDLGDVTAASGLLVIETGAVTSGKILNGTIAAADMNRWAPIPLVLCPPGMADAATPSVCATMTNQGAGPSSLGTGATMQWDTSSYTAFRLYAHVGGTGAVTGDLILRCDTSVNMGTTPTTMVTISEASLTANTIASSAWTPFSADECFGDDVYFNVAMTGGDGAEDPVFRRVYVAFR